MKTLVITGLALTLGLGNAYAVCTGTQLTATQIQTEIVGKTVCATLGGDKWQEEHRGSAPSGELWDFKRGPAAPNNPDPTERVGTWTIIPGTAATGGAKLQHSYTGGSSYNYVVRRAGTGLYDFCGTTNVPNATLGTIGSPCP